MALCRHVEWVALCRHLEWVALCRHLEWVALCRHLEWVALCRPLPYVVLVCRGTRVRSGRVGEFRRRKNVVNDNFSCVWCAYLSYVLLTLGDERDNPSESWRAPWQQMAFRTFRKCLCIAWEPFAQSKCYFDVDFLHHIRSKSSGDESCMWTDIFFPIPVHRTKTALTFKSGYVLHRRSERLTSTCFGYSHCPDWGSNHAVTDFQRFSKKCINSFEMRWIVTCDNESTVRRRRRKTTAGR